MTIRFKHIVYIGLPLILLAGLACVYSTVRMNQYRADWQREQEILEALGRDSVRTEHIDVAPWCVHFLARLRGEERFGDRVVAVRFTFPDPKLDFS
jgi:hypothetical protein